MKSTWKMGPLDYKTDYIESSILDDFKKIRNDKILPNQLNHIDAVPLNGSTLANDLYL